MGSWNEHKVCANEKKLPRLKWNFAKSYFLSFHTVKIYISRVVMILASLALGIVHTIDGYDVPWLVSTRIALVNVLIFLFCMCNICDIIFKNFLKTFFNRFLPNVPILIPLKISENPRFSDVFRGIKREHWEEKS